MSSLFNNETPTYFSAGAFGPGLPPPDPAAALEASLTQVDNLHIDAKSVWFSTMAVDTEVQVALNLDGTPLIEGTVTERGTTKVKVDVGDDAIAADRVADLTGDGRALMALLQRLGADPTMAPAAKLLRTELSVDLHELHASLRGPEAMLAGDATTAMLYSAGMRLAGGTSEIQRNIIAERLLGLPKEPRPRTSGSN